VSTTLRSGQLAEAAGVNVQTLRYYERRGLLPEPRRSLGGHREYGQDARGELADQGEMVAKRSPTTTISP
jgi:DNA-binding transcriptional MerR regulator